VFTAHSVVVNLSLSIISRNLKLGGGRGGGYVQMFGGSKHAGSAYLHYYFFFKQKIIP